MRQFKITTWNVMHMARVLGPGADEEARARRARIAGEILELDPDLLCLVEASPDVTHMRDFAAADLQGRYEVMTIPGTDEAMGDNPGDPPAALRDLYAMRGNIATGAQWVWFLLKRDWIEAGSVMSPEAFDAMAGYGHWKVPVWPSRQLRTHRHWRHPQVLALDLNGTRVEFIGAHMKSKHNRRRPFEDDGETFREEYLAEALKDRAHLATEAQHVRADLEARFRQEPDPAVMVMGDFNDGPGKERIEREFMLFDVISVLQGEVFFATRFLNHGLFDFSEDHRWSYHLDSGDRVDPERSPNVLLDHILFTQALVDHGRRPRVEAGSGLVEHAVHERINAGLSGREATSDHRPVSVHLSVGGAEV